MKGVKTVMLLASFTALLLWVGQALSGQGGLFMASVFAGVINFGTERLRKRASSQLGRRRGG